MAVAILPILFSIYLLIWINSFYDNGYLKTESEVKEIYIRIVNCAMAFSVVALPAIGYAADKLPLKYLVPFSFFLRGAIGTAFLMLVHTPDGIWTILVVLGLITCTTMENVMIQKLFMNGLPDATRGTMIGVFHLFGQLGQIFFTLACVSLIQKHGTKSPFALVLISDVILFLAGAVLGGLGYLDKPKETRPEIEFPHITSDL